MSRRYERGFLRIFRTRRLVEYVRQALEWLGTQRASLRSRTRSLDSPPSHRLQRFHLEALEPRLLLSADLVGAASIEHLPATVIPSDQPDRKSTRLNSSH